MLRDGVQARFLFLPDGEDPDTLIRQEGQQAFEDRLTKATPLSEFMLNHLAEPIDLSSADGKARLKEQATPLIARITDGVFKDLLFIQLSELIGLSSASLQQHIPHSNQAPQNAQSAMRNTQSRQAKHSIKIPPTRLAIALLLQSPEIARSCTIPDALQTSQMPGLPLLNQIYNTIIQTGTESTSILLERWRGNADEKTVHKLALQTLADSDATTRISEFNDSLSNLLNKHYEQRMEQLIEKSKNMPLDETEKAELTSLYQRRIADD